MRLIFITDTLSSGGSERVVSILANFFVEKQQTEIICLRKRDVFYKISPKVKIIFADDYARGWLGKLKWLREYVNGEDVLLPFMVKVYCVTLLAFLGKKIKVIASERNDPTTTGLPWKLLRPLLLTKVSALVVQTQYIKDFFSKRIKEKTTIIVNPIDLKNCYNGEWNRNSHLVLAVGRTDIQKNYPMLIRSFKRLHLSHPDYRLEIWGKRDISEEGEKLQNLIKEIGASKYISINDRTDDIVSLYSKAYMFVMSSDYEGLSNALIEAVCSGLPVISTKVSGATDVIKNGVNGILVDIRDENGFYEAMKYFIENPDEAEKMAREAITCRNMFEKEYICSQWESLINNING